MKIKLIKEVEIVQASLNQCSAINSVKQLKEVAKECAERLEKAINENKTKDNT